MSTLAERVPMADRFWAKVDKSGECWIWTAHVTTNGYGAIGRPGGGNGAMRAHRYSFMLHYGPIHRLDVVCHKCDNPRCVRPDHLFVGTNRDNTADMIAKGRGREQRKTHCPQGHPYSPENTYVDPRGKRSCRICRRDRWPIRQAWARRKRAESNGGAQ